MKQERDPRCISKGEMIYARRNRHRPFKRFFKAITPNFLWTFWHRQVARRWWWLKRAYVYYRDKKHCVYCQSYLKFHAFTVDHVKARSKGGSEWVTNLKCCCKFCNKHKSNLELTDSLISTLRIMGQERNRPTPRMIQSLQQLGVTVTPKLSRDEAVEIIQSVKNKVARAHGYADWKAFSGSKAFNRWRYATMRAAELDAHGRPRTSAINRAHHHE